MKQLKELMCKGPQVLMTLFFVALLSTGCGSLGVYEKMTLFSKHEWSSTNNPEMTFEITDTTALYNIYLIVRHTDAYRYNNIWINVTTKAPADTARTQLLNIALADNTKGWLGSGMDDIFDRRARITMNPVKLRKGIYTFRLHQAMREEPLGYVMSAGIRVEKTKP
jgi:gliding motility-associated lipoprotein GldH